MNPTFLVLVTTLAPLLAFAIGLLFLMKAPRMAQGVVLAGGLASVLCSLVLLATGPFEPVRHTWLVSGTLELRFGFMLDGLALSFGAVVALITFCVQVYSIGYMSHDPAKTRYFAMLGLFGWAMLSFVYAVDLLQAFIFWELVGLASFFLIGFWYEKPSASAAAKKAFVMTRVGDVGLFIGILLILDMTLLSDIPALLDVETGLVSVASSGQLTLILLLIFFGIMGKSAQFPLHTWLPDAMEGPTPVSALLHSATMVAAGVFLFARLHPLFMESAATIHVVLAVALFTTLLSATIAMVEKDIKKVLAYSSIGQLGFMLAALAAGGLLAGVLHLILHAVFKALLFLCAGSYIHHFHTNDMEEIGRRGGRRMKVTTLGLIAGGGALAGIPPLAGFFSKEEVLAALSHGGYTFHLLVALFAALLTAYYTFRMIFLVVLPRKMEAEVPKSIADSPLVMLAPMVLLIVGSVLGGAMLAPLAGLLGLEVPHHSLLSMAPALAVVAVGVGLAWWDFGRREAAREGFVTKLGPAYTLFRRQWYVDAFYRATFDRLVNAAARLLEGVENRGLDDGFDRLALGTRRGGAILARLQSGWVQGYIAGVVAVLTLAGLYFGFR